MKIVWTEEQKEKLNEYYKTDQYPTCEMKVELAKRFGRSKRQVTNWFKHKRASDRRWDKIMIQNRKMEQASKRKFAAVFFEYTSSSSTCSSQSPNYCPEPEEDEQPEAKRFKYNPDDLIYGISRAKLLFRFGVC